MNQLQKVANKIRKEIGQDITCSEELKGIKLEGEVTDWSDVIKAGKIAAKTDYRGVINNLYVKDIDHNKERKPEFTDDKIDGLTPDILIIGGGIIGTSIARELSKYKLDILLVEKESDVGLHQSSRNDGMVHPGVIPNPKSLKAMYNVRGNEMFESIANDLSVPYKTIGTLVLFQNRIISLLSKAFIHRAKQNGVRGVRKVNRKEILKKLPNVPDNIVSGVYMPTTGVCPPYQMTVAMAENAIVNGVIVSLNTHVSKIVREENKVTSVVTNRGNVYPKIVINAAGLYSDKIAEMANDRFFTIHPRKGQVVLLDKTEGAKLDAVISVVTLKVVLNSSTKGGGLVKTTYGNILAGPSALEQPYKEDYTTDRETIEKVLEKNLPHIKGLRRNSVITYLAGNRAATYKEDFIIEPSKYVENLIYAAGIQSPGYASSFAIAEDIANMAVEKMQNIRSVEKKENFIKIRKGIPRLSSMSDEQRNKLISERPEYGEIICRCEEISKGEILDAIHAPMPALTVDSIKRRTRCGMGRCQGGFCKPLIAQIIHEETGLSMKKILSKGGIEIDTKRI